MPSRSSGRSRGLGRIGLRIVGPVLLLTALLVAALAWSVYLQVGRSRAESVDRYVKLVGRLALSHLRDGMQAEDRPRLQRQIVRIGKLDGVASVEVIDKQGRIVFSSNARDIGRVLTVDEPRCAACHRGQQEPLGGDQTVELSADGRDVVRAIHPIVVQPECRRCHHLPVGKLLGVLVTDLDQLALTAPARARATTTLVFAALMTLIVVVVVLVSVRRLVVARLRYLTRVVDGFRAGVRSLPVVGESRDEIDELTRALSAFALELDEQLVLQRASSAVAAAMARCPTPALAYDASGRVLAFNPAAAELLGKTSEIVGIRRAELVDDPAALVSAAREAGWALSERGGDGPAIAALFSRGGDLVAFVEVWSEQQTESDGAPTPGRPTEIEHAALWSLYATVVLGKLAPKQHYRGVRTFDRRLALARHLTTDLGRTVELTRDWAEVNLCALGELVMHALRSEVPPVHWLGLLDTTHRIQGSRSQLRVLVARLLRAAALQAGSDGEVLWFARVTDDKLFLGAWAGVSGGEVAIDPDDEPPLAQAIAIAHGGGVEVDPKFDARRVAEQGGLRLSGGGVGTLYVARLDRSLRPARATG